MGQVNYLLEMIGIGVIIPAATCDLHLDTVRKGLLTGSYVLGTLLTGYLGGFLTDTFGRRKLIIYAMSLSLAFSVLAALSPHYWVMWTFRFLSGAAFVYLSHINLY